MSEETLSDKLTKKFNKTLIKKRKMPGGMMAQYVEGSSVIKRLNECFGTNWSFEVVKEKIGETQIIVLGRLSVMIDGEHVMKEQWGGSAIAKFKSSGEIINLGNDIKAATTDSLKKCATLFGVALHLYEQDEVLNTFDQILNGSTEPEKKENPQPTKEEKQSLDKPSTMAQHKAINAVLSKKGVTLDALLSFLDVKDIKNILYKDASLIITEKHKFWSHV